jgi:hypothetical protein
MERWQVARVRHLQQRCVGLPVEEENREGRRDRSCDEGRKLSRGREELEARTHRRGRELRNDLAVELEVVRDERVPRGSEEDVRDEGVSATLWKKR